MYPDGNPLNANFRPVPVQGKTDTGRMLDRAVGEYPGAIPLFDEVDEERASRE